MIHGIKTLAAMLLLALVGCSVTGQDFQASNISSLTPGQTTMSQAAYILAAPPDTIYPQSDGTTLALWRYKATVVEGVYARQEAMLQFGPDGRLIRLVDATNIPMLPSTRRKLLGVEPPPAAPAPGADPLAQPTAQPMTQLQVQPAATSVENVKPPIMTESPLSTTTRQIYSFPIPPAPTPVQ